MKISIQQAKEFFENHPQNTTPNFKKNHQAPVLRLLNDCLEVQDDIVDCLSDAREVIDKIKNKYKNHNTIKYYLQALLFFVDSFPNLRDFVNRDEIFKAWQASKLTMIEGEEERKKNIANIEYDDIKEKVYEKFGSNSQEALFIDFYEEVPLRLDFYDIKLFRNTKDLPEDDVPPKYLNLETGRLFMKDYTKTKNKYGDKEVYLSKELMEKIKYNLKNKPREYLFKFKNKDPSAAIKTLLRQAGIINASMNTLRHSVHTKTMTPEERIEMARRSGHAPETSLDYRRPKEKLTSIEVPEKHLETVKYFVTELNKM